ncbi:MAG: SBBP repeat-containing protein [Flavobacteriales bacterium]|nr:SBBP repeat-containing protein [Flavobacteriales bacterium]
MRKEMTLSGYVLFVLGTSNYCMAQEPYIPKDLNNEPYSHAWTYVPNNGQVFDLDGNYREDVMYHSVGTMPTVYMQRNARTAITFPDIHAEDSTLDRLIRIDMSLENSSAKPPVLKDPVPMRYNFYEQYTPDGITDVTGGKRIIYQEVYPAIDYHIFSNENGPKFLIVVNQDGDPEDIVFNFSGQDSLKVDIDGFLKLHADDKVLVFPEGLVYQQQDQTVIPITWVAHYDLQTQTTVKLELGAYNHDLPLMILIQPLAGMGGGGGGQAVTPPEWSTYMAGTGYDDMINDMTHDQDGNLYFIGASRSTSGLPTTPGLIQIPAGWLDVILGRVNPHYEVQAPETWMTYYGGSNADAGTAIAYDQANARLVTCGTSDSPAGQLIFQGTYSTPQNGSGLVALFDLDGHRTYSTRLGATPGLDANDLDVDEAGNTYVVGHGLFDSGFPIVDPSGNDDYTAQQGPQTPGGLYFDAFVRRYSATMNLTWSTALGGPGDETGRACAVDHYTHTLYVVGSTNTPNDLSRPDCPSSGSFDFPLCNEVNGYYQDLLNGVNDPYFEQDAFVTAFDLNNLHMKWSTYLGSLAQIESATDVAVDAKGSVYITGFTNMGWCTNYCIWEPTHFTGCENGQYYNASPNGYGASHFIYRFDEYQQMTWGTLIGGQHSEYYGNLSRARVTCDENDNVHLFGSSNSAVYPPEAPVLPPVSNNLFYDQGGHADAPQPFAAVLPWDTYIGGFTPEGDLFYSTYFGGWGNDYAGAVEAFNGRVYICGSTASALNFPTHAPVLTGYTPYLNPTPSAATTDLDAFLAQIKFDFTIGVQELGVTEELAPLLLSPNPTNDFLTVRTELMDLDRVEVLNALGQLVLSLPLHQGLLRMDVSHLPAATYIIRATGTGRSAYTRFIKQ